MFLYEVQIGYSGAKTSKTFFGKFRKMSEKKILSQIFIENQNKTVRIRKIVVLRF